MKKSKQAEASESEDGVDMISKMPDHVLQLILSRLQGTEEVVRTSILSTRWRHLWIPIPCVDIDDFRGMNLLQRFDKTKFREFVFWVLANKSVDLDSFRLSYVFYYNKSTLGQWIHIAVMKNVKKLDLVLSPRSKSEVVKVPHCLVTCSSLEELRLSLSGCHLSVPNITTGFSALKVLVLKKVDLFDDFSVKYFFESCPLLEELWLIDCFIHELYTLRISCPNLKSLTIVNKAGVSYEVFKKNKGMFDTLKISCPKLVSLMLSGYVAGEFIFETSMPSLKEVFIHPEELTEDERPLVDGFVGISHVELLCITLYCVSMCYFPPNDVPVSLPNLKTLEITTGAFAMNDLIPFLICFPHLETLRLFITQVDQLEDWKLDDIASMRILTRHLKLVEFLGFDGDDRKLAIARAIMEHGDALEEMVFLWQQDAKHHEKSMEAMKEMSNFHKASSTVKLTTVLQPAHPRFKL
ncbi:unnamed protein product [Lactuca saligna]|uniref:F-box domain-containing protein n=1 Tax=Lactuca saligna TaxID=75948 RepID=A0AA36EGB3_LACSI|nr:unnamed protein product [Lactuca saligna]